MNADIESILLRLPDRIAWEDTAQAEHLDERVTIANYLYGDIIGVGQGYVEWCPDTHPPSREETLAWWWVVRPDLGAAIAYEAPGELRQAIAEYVVETT